MASMTLADGAIVSALAVVNSIGSVINPETALPWDLVQGRLHKPSAIDRRRLINYLSSLQQGSKVPSSPSLNTTIGVVATNQSLTKSECKKFASVAHDGLAHCGAVAAKSHHGADAAFSGDGHHAAFGYGLGEGGAVGHARAQGQCGSDGYCSVQGEGGSTCAAGIARRIGDTRDQGGFERCLIDSRLPVLPGCDGVGQAAAAAGA